MTLEHKQFAAWFHRKGWRDIIIAIPYAWLITFFLFPLFIVIAISLARRADLSPPIAYEEHWPYLRWDNFARLFTDTLYIRAYLTSIWNAAVATFFCLLIGYPMALGITRSASHGATSC